MKEPTKRQRRMLWLIIAHQRAFNYPPTTRELGEAMGIKSVNGVHDYLKALERKGCVTWEAGKPRTLQVTGVGAAAALSAPR